MIDYQVLRDLVLEAFKAKPKAQFTSIFSHVQKLAAERNVFPSAEECKQRNIVYTYYEQKRLNPIDEQNVNQIVWDLIIDRVLTMGAEPSNPDVRRHAAEEPGATGPGRLTRDECNKAAWRRKGTSVERCLRNALKAGAPVGRTSARAEVTPLELDDRATSRISCIRRLSGV